ncbi:hypothetical protein JCM16303_000266 [Sporobolomyces ruberrimus]
MEESQLVRELTEKLETLQHEKQRLERAIEGQADSIALKLRLALLATGEGARANNVEPSTDHHGRSHSRHSQGRRRKLSSTSPSSSISASSTNSSSASFPSSPSPLLSPILANASSSLHQPPPDVLAALRENSELRTRLANSERVNQYYQREIADLRRICGVSIDEFEELDPRSHSYGIPSTSTRRRSISTRSQPNGTSSTVGSIRIPGATSVSPPSIRPSSTSSYPSQSHHASQPPSYGLSYSYSLSSSSHFPSQNPRFLPHSYTSSINTTLTTPSSSFPVANPPAPTPSTSLDFIQDQTLVLPSPPPSTTLPSTSAQASSPSISSSNDFQDQLSLALLQSTANTTTNRTYENEFESSSIDRSPPLPPTADTPTKLSVITSLDTVGSAAGPSTRGTRRSYRSNGNGNGGASTENSTIKRGSKRRNGASSNGKQRSTLVRKSYPQSSDVGPNRKRPGPEPSQVEVGAAEVDPLVEAVTNSLEKLIRQNEGSRGSGEEGGIRRRIRRFSNEPQEEEEVEDEIDNQALRGAAGKGKVEIVIGKGVGEDQGEEFSTEEEEEEDGEDDDDDDGSSTTSREEEDKYVQLRAEIARLQRQIQLGQVGQGQLSRSAKYGGGSGGYGHEEGEEEDEDDEGTPLSVSPGSRGRSRRESSAM